MGRLLADLLGNNHPLFVRNMTRMEQATGHAGIDTRLIADITEKAHAVMREMGLDPVDTSARELYMSLISTVSRSGQAERLLGDTHYVLLLVENELISFCLHDVIENAHHQLPFEARKYDHAQRHLRAEIVKRYAEHDRTSNTMVEEIAREVGLIQPNDGDYPRLETSQSEVSDEAPNMLMIGDVFTDAFIKLTDEAAKIIKDNDGTEWLAVPFGRKPPYERVDIVRSVGPSPNVAVSMARLGLNAGLMAWIGDDDTGKEALEHLKSERVNTDSMVTEAGKLTSYWYVLRYGADRTMLVKSEKYRYEWRDPDVTPDWIYLSYLGEDSWQLHEDLLAYLERNPDIKLAFQPGTFQFKWGVEKLAALYGRSHIVLMNREEAMDVTGLPYDSLHDLAKGLHDLGPEKVVITDGPNGSYASFDSRLVTIPNYPDPKPPVERTGAGDAFASTIVAGLALGKSMEEALSWAPINSMNVVQYIGAQAGLLRINEIEKYLEQAPDNYKVSDV